jgi:hypothetical protein
MEHRNKKNNASHNNLSESRFKMLLLLLRTAGIQINMKSVSRANIAYKVILLLCFHISVFSLYMETYVHRHQLPEFTRQMRLLMANQIITWILISLR